MGGRGGGKKGAGGGGGGGGAAGEAKNLAGIEKKLSADLRYAKDQARSVISHEKTLKWVKKMDIITKNLKKVRAKRKGLLSIIAKGGK